MNMPTPAEMAAAAQNPSAKARRDQLRMEQLYKDGVQEGRIQVRAEMLTWLQHQYIGDNAVTDPEQRRAILVVTRDMAEHFRRQWHL